MAWLDVELGTALAINESLSIIFPFWKMILRNLPGRVSSCRHASLLSALIIEVNILSQRKIMINIQSNQ